MGAETDNHEQYGNTVATSGKFLSLYGREGDKLLNKIATTDETPLFLHDLETKNLSWQRKMDCPPPPKKLRQSQFFLDWDDTTACSPHSHNRECWVLSKCKQNIYLK